MDSILTNPKYHDIFSILKGFRNGAVYGARIRFPHALVMQVLFGTGTIEQKFKRITEATIQHSRNLAFFVTIYKTLMVLQRRIKGREDSADSFIAGLIGGYFIFGDDNNINQQINMYLLSRITFGIAKMAVKRGIVPEPPHSFPIFAATVWGIVMWQFRHERDVLQSSLQSSMQFLYNDSEVFSNLGNWLWRNR
ncbi:peroxisomal membrane protein 4 [Rhizoclosmatium globosum]|uniref:Peroxisomal membrane protein 4 n=1 Tax=Rhizoclosmatium globosum TaxID=329046 RepID=A0A1Y2CHA3_9FUNG|nr:Peroxisomal membrane protein 4 [Rhizoclosmatium hyalinum]KAJ3285612.1 Peroxisomal membrane protein 4 [Rhizoclosmatium sp. JEL0117]ORY46392.1 peroxisomal membrane protein 4 [Rhizoclosmatium globosum]|eukprot:ORY46392.1 peroxisomal membrane protein 4 [Rhizoclosmatium globosum]